MLLHALLGVNSLLLKPGDTEKLFRMVCDRLVASGCYSAAWVGLIVPGNFKIVPFASSGLEDASWKSMEVTWDNSPYGFTPAGKAIKARKACVMADAATDPQVTQHWREMCRQKAYQSAAAFPVIVNGDLHAVLELYSGAVDGFGREEVDVLASVTANIGLALELAEAEIKRWESDRALQAKLDDFKAMTAGVVKAMSSLVDIIDPFTTGHQRQVAGLACAMAQDMGLPAEEVAGIKVAGLLHDVGKIAVPAGILRKIEALSEEEMSLVRKHPLVGYDILKNIDFGSPVAEVALQHHERLDGSGYPFGLRATATCLEARIVAVADVVEAIAAQRPYRQDMGLAKALEEISRGKSVLYDPWPVDSCLKVFNEKLFSFDHPDGPAEPQDPQNLAV